jgi:hypothetical protein
MVYVLRQNCRAAGWRWDSINIGVRLLIRMITVRHVSTLGKKLQLHIRLSVAPNRILL